MNLLPPLMHVEAIDRAELNRCLVAWGHRMGPLERPVLAIDAHYALFHHGRPVAAAASSDTVAATVGQTLLKRREVVELSRLCADRPALCRVMLRIWRDFLFPDIAAAHRRSFAISYQDEALHNGDTYRFDGWETIGRSHSGVDRRSGREGRDKAIWGWPRGIAAEVEARKQSRAA